MLTQDALTGKHALVCGASQGIGQACAIELAKAGARVTVLARNKQSLETTLATLAQYGSGHKAVICDLSDMRQLSSILPTTCADVDILICNSGGPAPGPMTAAEAPALEAAFTQHVLSNVALIQACSVHMKKQKYGRVINIISTSVKVPLPNLGVSNTVRAAMASSAKTFANELGAFGITVNNILPGFTKTQRLEQIIQNNQAKTGNERSEVEDGFMKDVPAKRFGEAQETAFAVLFLASPFASYINGVNLPVDGGRTGCL
jgi:3-oxoacyl-[acyl-carrier protein] reductase